MLTQDEAELYDRQIRLWGVNAQSRLRQSKVLMLGFNGVASEVAKILVLAGIDTLTIVDDQALLDEDLTSNLFCRHDVSPEKNTKNQFRTHQVEDKLRRLNPLVKVKIENSPISSKKSDDFKHHDLVTLHTFMTIDAINAINNDCRSNGVKFYLVLDYGFFGFIFNDLGSNFKFTYEEYGKILEEANSKKSPTGKQSGQKRDPIDLDQDDDESIDLSDDNDRQNNSRPKKRRRYHSPPREADSHTKDKNEKKHKVDKFSYVSFEDMISCEGANFDKKSSPVLFISIAILKFFTKHERLPSNVSGGKEYSDPEQLSKDTSDLNEIIASLKDALNLHEGIFKKLDSQWSRNMAGSLSPVCAILGGVAGQDIIRSLSGKDIPICNTFSFDGMDMSGVVERLGVKTKETNSVAPVIRDYLEID